MKKIIFILMVLISAHAMAQPPGRVDKKTKEFFIPTGQKTTYQIFGFQYANATTKRMICFSSNTNDVRDNFSKCPLGSYFDTSNMLEGGKITYLGTVGNFAKMNYTNGLGKKTLFYLPKNSFIINK